MFFLPTPCATSHFVPLRLVSPNKTFTYKNLLSKKRSKNAVYAPSLHDSEVIPAMTSIIMHSIGKWIIGSTKSCVEYLVPGFLTRWIGKGSRKCLCSPWPAMNIWISTLVRSDRPGKLQPRQKPCQLDRVGLLDSEDLVSEDVMAAAVRNSEDVNIRHL